MIRDSGSPNPYKTTFNVGVCCGNRTFTVTYGPTQRPKGIQKGIRNRTSALSFSENNNMETQGN